MEIMPQYLQTLAPITGPHVKANVTAPQPKPRVKLANAPTISSQRKDCMMRCTPNHEPSGGSCGVNASATELLAKSHQHVQCQQAIKEQSNLRSFFQVLRSATKNNNAPVDYKSDYCLWAMIAGHIDIMWQLPPPSSV